MRQEVGNGKQIITKKTLIKCMIISPCTGVHLPHSHDYFLDSTAIFNQKSLISSLAGRCNPLFQALQL